MSLKIKLIIAYDGSCFFGWQDNGRIKSVESSLRNALEQILQAKVILDAASRTDAGVHAIGQVVSFILPKASINLVRLQTSLNQLLDGEIAILDCEVVPLSFHPSLDVIAKEYGYFICEGKSQLPQHRKTSWHVKANLDLELIKKGAQYFIGTHDFSSFCNARKNSRYEHTIRTIYSLTIERISGERRIYIKIQGNNFLYKMARNIIGTLVYLGKKKLQLANIPEIFSAKNRIHSGVTAPAHGLFLNKVIYSEMH
ncbi:MAG: tRNA pseudouridine(38-40) synthase TruA [Chlamydiales bacterium]